MRTMILQLGVCCSHLKPRFLAVLHRGPLTIKVVVRELNFRYF
jgi:hypothetical protein